MHLTLESACLRANPNYDLIRYEQLSESEKQEWQNMTRDPDFCAILRTRQGSGQRIKLICKNTADLYSSLTTAGPLPSGMKADLGDTFKQTVAQLIADGILELEHEGSFISGVEAYDLIRSQDAGLHAVGRIARLSLEALRYGQSLAIHDSRRLCARLYFYNRIAASPDLRHKFPDDEAVARFLGVSSAGALGKVLEQSWVPGEFFDSNDGWLLWHNRGGRGSAIPGSVTYKLYISPLPDALPEILPAVLALITEHGAPAFKSGKDLYGMLRPDKFIVYFSNFDHLQHVASRLTTELRHAPVHGVPFTAELACDGLLSWGIDPPVLPAQGADTPESWRSWLTSRLAHALIAAKASSVQNVEPWRFALERVRLEGVDTDTWTSSASVWQAH
jgi:hypothetical protein